MRTGISITLKPADRRRLKALARDRNAPHKHVWRAEIVLFSADSVGTNEIMRRTGKSKTCVWRWQERFMQEGYDGLLRDKTRPSRIPSLGSNITERVVTLTQTDPPAEATHWTSAMMAKVVDISASSIQRIWQLGNVAFANVHLSHGQFLNRWQLLHIANALDGPAAVVGDYNAIGPIKLAGFKDIGPRQPTHSPSNIISFRLDRCMVRGLRCSYARVLARGPFRPSSDQARSGCPAGRPSLGWIRHRTCSASHARASVERWVRAMSDAPNRIRVRQTFFETLDLKFRKGKRGKAQRQRPAPTSNNELAR